MFDSCLFELGDEVLEGSDFLSWNGDDDNFGSEEDWVNGLLFRNVYDKRRDTLKLGRSGSGAA